MTDDHPQSGFTLIELLVVLALLALLAGYASLALGQMNGLRAVEARLARDAEINAAFQHLRQAIDRAAPVMLGVDQAERRLAFIGEPNRLLLVSPGEPLLEAGGLHLVEYFVEDMKGVSWLVTRRKPYRISSAELLADAQNVRVLRDVTQLRFRYFGPSAEGEPDAWLDKWQRTDALPRLVEVEVQLKEPTVKAQPPRLFPVALSW